MKKVFKRKGDFWFDEVRNESFHKSIFRDIKNTKLSAKLRKKYLDDLNTGSDTELQSAQKLIQNQEESSEFLEWLLKNCEKDGGYPSIPYALLNFANDNRVLPALLEVAQKTSDENFSNYADILGMLGGKEALQTLHKRFDQIKENSKTFQKSEFWNELGLTLEVICQSILLNEPNNDEAARTLIRLTEHPCSFNKERAVRTIVSFHSHECRHISLTIRKLFGEKLIALLKTKNSGLFVAAMPFLFNFEPEKAYQKLKGFYLKADQHKRIDEMFFWLLKIDYNSAYWISRLVRELPEEETKPLQEILTSWLVRPITEIELFDSVRQDLADASPSKRHSAVVRFSHLNLSRDRTERLAAEAINDEPESLIRKKLSKFIKL